MTTWDEENLWECLLKVRYCPVLMVRPVWLKCGVGRSFYAFLCVSCQCALFRNLLKSWDIYLWTTLSLFFSSPFLLFKTLSTYDTAKHFFFNCLLLIVLTVYYLLFSCSENLCLFFWMPGVYVFRHASLFPCFFPSLSVYCKLSQAWSTVGSE